MEIVGIDNLCRSGSELNRSRLNALSVEVRHGDIRCRSDIETIPAAEWVIDCAALPSVLAGTDGHGSARQLVEHNLIGTLNLLDYCRQHNSGLILLSTSRVYSIRDLCSLPLIAEDGAFRLQSEELQIPHVGPEGLTEQFSTTPPISLYGATKRASEIMAEEFSEAFGFPLRIDRCGVIGGAGQFARPDQGIFSFWVHSFAVRRPLKYIGFGGTGHQVRDVLHPRDLSRLIAAQIKAGDDKSKPRLMHVSGGLTSARSLKQITQWCESRFSSHAIDVDCTPRQFDVPWLVLDSGLAKRAWGWEPTISTENILSEIADHATDNPDWLMTTSG